MKLLLDENLSDRLVPALADLFPGSRHVKELGLLHSTDDGLWEHAGKNGFVLLTKDKDFQQLCALRGAPPKVVWLRVGNCSTKQLAELLRRSVAVLRAFASDTKTVLLILAHTDASG